MSNRKKNKNKRRGTEKKLSVNFLILVIVLLLVAVCGGGYYMWQHKDTPEAKDIKGGENTTQTVQYICPMHPFIIKDKPGDCPVCGMALVKKTKNN